MTDGDAAPASRVRRRRAANARSRCDCTTRAHEACFIACFGADPNVRCEPLRALELSRTPAQVRPDRLRLGRHAVRLDRADHALHPGGLCATSACRCRATATPATSSAWACARRCSTPRPACRASATPSSACATATTTWRASTSCVLFDGTLEMLQALKARNHLLGGGDRQVARGLDDALARRRSCTACSTPRAPPTRRRRKPHPQMLLELMDELGVAPERTLMIGDTTHDLQLAAECRRGQRRRELRRARPRGVRRPSTAPRRPQRCADLHDWLLEHA